MDTTIINLLQCTKHQYEMTVFNHFMWWCELNAYSNADLQRMLANKQINGWFLKQYKIHQKTFIEKAKPYAQLNMKDEMYKLYMDEVRKIKHFYPKILLIAIRKKSYPIIGQSNN